MEKVLAHTLPYSDYTTQVRSVMSKKKIIKIMPDDMSIKAICLDCKNYDRKGGICTGTNTYAKAGDTHFLLLFDKSSCFGFEQVKT